jgi:hypothetical protein
VTAWGHTTSTKGVYSHAFIGDTLTFDRLTVTGGVRWDRQASSVNELAAAGNPILPTLLPDLTGTAANDVVVWNSVTPRVGFSYALDEARRTLVRGSYGMFASQLNATEGGFLSAVQNRGVYFYDVVDTNGNQHVDAADLTAFDTNGDGRIDAGEVDASGGAWYGFDIENPADLTVINRVGDYSTPLTQEVQFGMDREVLPNFGLSGTFTWRRFTNFTWRHNGITGEDYVQIGTLEGSHPAVGAYSVPVFGVAEDRVPPPSERASTTYMKREGYSQRYWGIELAATKRLSDRWMLRVGFSSNDHREYFDGLHSMGDPTHLLPSVLSPLLGTGPNQNGGLVMRNTTGSGKSGIYQLLPKYQIVTTGLYQAPWGINLAGNLVTRQGFATPYHSLEETTDPLADQKTILVVDDVGDRRLPTVTSLDARIGKEFAFNRFRFNVDVDVFNLLNSNTVLGRQYDLASGAGDDVLEIMNPRVVRFGVRVNF